MPASFPTNFDALLRMIQQALARQKLVDAGAQARDQWMNNYKGGSYWSPVTTYNPVGSVPSTDRDTWMSLYKGGSDWLPTQAEQDPMSLMPWLPMDQVGAGTTLAGGGYGSGLPSYDFGSLWQYGSGQNPLAGVPLEYWDYALASLNTALPWAQQSDLNAQRAIENGQWGQQFGEGQRQFNESLGFQKSEAQRAAEQWLQQFTSSEDQRGISNKLNQDQFDWGKNTWGQEFQRAQGNDAWARSNDAWNQAMQAATFDWQKEMGKEQNRITDEGNALAAWGRRSSPLVSAM